MSSWPMHQWIFYVSLEVEYFLLVGSLWQTGKFCTITCGQQLRIWVFNMSWRFGCDFILHHVEIHFPHAGSSPWKCWKVKLKLHMHYITCYNLIKFFDSSVFVTTDSPLLRRYGVHCLFEGDGNKPTSTLERCACELHSIASRLLLLFLFRLRRFFFAIFAWTQVAKIRQGAK
jgi:hypothetical protein